MNNKTIRRFILGSLFTSLITLSACGSAVTSDCEEAAKAQCSLCFQCAIETTNQSELNNIDGGALCQTMAGATQDQCVTTLTSRCEEQATGRQNTNEEIQACEESISNLECEKIHQAYALDQSYATNQCARYF